MAEIVPKLLAQWEVTQPGFLASRGPMPLSIAEHLVRSLLLLLGKPESSLRELLKGMRVSWGKFIFLSCVTKSMHFAWVFPQHVWLFSGEGSWRGITASVALLWKYPARRWSSIVDISVTPRDFRKSVFCSQPSSWLPVTLLEVWTSPSRNEAKNTCCSLLRKQCLQSIV